jgi:hypothetical protein
VVETARARLDVLEEPVLDQVLGGRQVVASNMVVPNDLTERPP